MLRVRHKWKNLTWAASFRHHHYDRQTWICRYVLPTEGGGKGLGVELVANTGIAGRLHPRWESSATLSLGEQKSFYHLIGRRGSVSVNCESLSVNFIFLQPSKQFDGSLVGRCVIAGREIDVGMQSGMWSVNTCVSITIMLSVLKTQVARAYVRLLQHVRPLREYSPWVLEIGTFQICAGKTSALFLMLRE